MENLLPLIIFGLIAAVSAWLKHRRGEQERDWELPPTQPDSPPARPARSWEQQMRELLADAGPVSPAPPPIPPAPPVMAPRPQVRPPAPYRVPAPQRVLPVPAAHFVPEPVPSIRPTPDLLARAHATTDLLARARSSYAQSLDVDARVRKQHQALSAGLGLKHPGREGSGGPFDAGRALGFLRHREGLKAAVLASIILGPPKALQEE